MENVEEGTFIALQDFLAYIYREALFHLKNPNQREAMTEPDSSDFP